MRCSSWGRSQMRIAECGMRIGRGISRSWSEVGEPPCCEPERDSGLRQRLPMLQAAFPGTPCEPTLSVPERDRAKAWTREDAVRELVRGRLEAVGPTTT